MKDILEYISENPVVEAIKHRASEQQEKRKKSGREIVEVHSRVELSDLVGREIMENGPECDLNFIDVSEIVDFSYLFYNHRQFDGDISDWNMENAVDCSNMFYMSSFTGKNGSINGWDVRKIKYASRMFYKSKYAGSLSDWDLRDLDIKNSPQFMGGAVIAKTRKFWPKRFR